MPGMDGLMMVREVRGTPELAAIPIIVLTAYEQEMAEKALQAGATRLLRKPMDFDDLIAEVERLLPPLPLFRKRSIVSLARGRGLARRRGG
jgi:CheY-like chemotaxis protein